MNKVIWMVGVLALAGCVTETKRLTGSGAEAPALNVSEVKRAQAKLQPKSGSKVTGTLQLEDRAGKLTISYRIKGLKPNGIHGFHLHENGDCSGKDAKAAGDHFNPQHRLHGSTTGAERHAGDFGNISANAKGEAQGEIIAESLSLEGPNSAMGKAIIIHANMDDFKTQPSGNAGARIACGVVK